MRKFLNSLKKKWWFTLIFYPRIYLMGLIVNTASIGVVGTLLVYGFQYFYDTHQQTIPPSFHSILGVVLGLLLVFRTNTAYERWWKAREYFAKVESLYIHLIIKMKIKDEEKNDVVTDLLNTSLDNLENFLVRDHGRKYKEAYIDNIESLMIIDKYHEYGVDESLKQMMDTFTSLERISDTPIPTSYSLHIKVSIFMYFLTLPFGILYETGYWSILLMMILYYVVAGIEIISNEIENPFRGDPNDLPIKTYIQNLKQEILRLTS